jgi:NADPH2:quinone reductase
VAALAPVKLGPLGSPFLPRPLLRDYVATLKKLLDKANAVFAAVISGTLVVRIDQTFRLEEAALAHTALDGRRSTGKLLLLP